MFTYVGNNPINRIDPMGLEKVLVVVGFREEGTPYELDDDGNIIGSSDSYHRSSLYYLKKKLESQGHKFDLVFVKTFDEFDNAINEKDRDMIYFIGHGTPKSIEINSNDLNNNNSYINYQNLKNDKQTKEQSIRLKKTDIILHSCNTGNDVEGGDTIGKQLHNHYNFKTTYAPTDYIYSDGEVGRLRNPIIPRRFKKEEPFSVYK